MTSQISFSNQPDSQKNPLNSSQTQWIHEWIFPNYSLETFPIHKPMEKKYKALLRPEKE